VEGRGNQIHEEGPVAGVSPIKTRRTTGRLARFFQTAFAVAHFRSNPRTSR
jgi:hypothetical protein